MKIINRYNESILWEGEAASIKEALALAIQQRANLRDANLRDADLGGANLRGANLRGANLRDADLGGANLRGANLRGANLRGANLRGANLRDANLRDADFNLVPKIKNIHRSIYQAVTAPGNQLEMENWHTCETAHCRAGWIIVLCGEAGKILEEWLGTPTAAALIYQASDPTLEKVPDFYAANEEAMDDIKRLAELEACRTGLSKEGDA
ncbi:MAG: pentapeptide repeat-containing protein [Nitrospirales bacterium]